MTHKQGEVWFADLVQTGERWSGASRKELFDKFAQELLNRTYAKHLRRPGRPEKNSIPTHLRLTPFARTYLDRLAKVLNVDWSTCVQYLLCKAHQAMVENFEVEEAEEVESMTDDAGLVETLRQKSFPEPNKAKTPRQIMKELENERESEMTELAQRIRTEMELEQETKAFKTRQRTVKLAAEEKAAERRIKRANDEYR